MKKVNRLWSWMTGKEKISAIVLVLSGIISLTTVSKIVTVLIRAWNDLNGIGIGYLVFLGITQVAVFGYVVFTLIRFIDNRNWYINWYETNFSRKGS